MSRLPQPPQRYDPNDQAQLRRTVDTLLGQTFQKPQTLPIVTGSKGANAALASLLTALASLGLIIDNST